MTATQSLPNPVTNHDRHHLASNKAHQLKHLLYVMYGGGKDFVTEMGAENRDAILWIAADLATDLEALIDQMEVSHG